MRIPKSLRKLSGVVVVAALGAVAFFTSEQWMPLVIRKSAESATAEDAAPPVEEPGLDEAAAELLELFRLRHRGAEARRDYVPAA